MIRKPRNPNFDQAMAILDTHSFDVVSYPGVANAVLIRKYGAGAVMIPTRAKDGGEEPAAAFLGRPGWVVAGEVAQLVDRGYQKFLQVSRYELPASASQLQAVHLFGEELKLLIGAVSLYNESLGTTSDIYRYDRLKGREKAEAAPASPWQLAQGH